MSICTLISYSDFSPQDGISRTKHIARRAAELGMEACALTDHGRAGGLMLFDRYCKEFKIKPIYGYEAYVAPNSRLVRDKVEGHRTSYHLTILAKNEEGLRNVFRLCSMGWLDGFYYKPRIDFEILKRHHEGLVILSGCSASKFSHFILENRLEEAERHLLEMREVFKDDFYIEVQNHGLDWQLPLKASCFDFANKLSIPPVATQDSHYLMLDDYMLHKHVAHLMAGDLEFETDQSWFKSYDEMKAMFSTDEWHAIDRTNEVAGKCNVEWRYGTTIWPSYSLPKGRAPEEELREGARHGLKERFGGLRESYPESYTRYRERLDYELGVIEKMGFATYFLVVADFLNYARSQGIPVGPGRGSGAGSLVCYCIGITEVDPIKYGLYFERFLNPERVSLPDLDLDICKERRGEVVQYITEKYGRDKVAQIGTYSVFKPRGALRDFARVITHDPAIGNELANLVPPDIAGKALTFAEALEAEPRLKSTPHQEVLKVAIKAEGLHNNAGIHAAGIVISNQELMSQVPLFRGKHDEIATQFDMHDIERLGLVKFDLLGLKNLTVISDTINLIKRIKEIEIDISKINHEDPEVFNNVFKRGELDGVFQFETSSGFRDLCIRVAPESVEDLAAISSLFRPGPIQTGLLDKYITGRNGAGISYLTPELEPILKNTYGVMVYQEQIMKICIDLAGYTASESDDIRKAIGKKIAEKMAEHRNKFITGCTKNNISKDIATKLFNDIEGFSKYSFNCAHAIAYSIISYRTAWLKTYYPQEFYTALLNNSLGDQNDMVKYIHACKSAGIPIEPPDINRSQVGFTLDNGTIVFGLTGVKGVGAKACEQLIANRPEEGFKSLEEFILSGAHLNVITALAECGALASITDIDRSQLSMHAGELVEYYKKVKHFNERIAGCKAREIEIEAAVNRGERPPRRLPSPKAPPATVELSKVTAESRITRLSLERKTLGFYLTGHPLDEYPGVTDTAKHTIQDIKEGKVADGEVVQIPIVISSLEIKRTRTKKNMAIAIVEDRSGRMEGTIFPRQWEKLRDILAEDLVCAVQGTVRKVIGENPEAPPMARLVISSARPLAQDRSLYEMRELIYTLQDESRVTFTPTKEVAFQAWQQAAAIVNNLQRMGMK